MESNGKVAASFLDVLLEAYSDIEQPNLPVGELLSDLKMYANPGTWLIDVEKAFVIGYRQGIIDAKASLSPVEPISPLT